MGREKEALGGVRRVDREAKKVPWKRVRVVRQFNVMRRSVLTFHVCIVLQQQRKMQGAPDPIAAAGELCEVVADDREKTTAVRPLSA